MLQSPLLGLGEEDEADLTDWNLPLAFMKKRHCEKIEGSKSLAQSWRMKDRVSGFRLRPLDLGGFSHGESSEPEESPRESSGIFSQPHVASQLKKHEPFQTLVFGCKWKKGVLVGSYALDNVTLIQTKFWFRQ